MEFNFGRDFKNNVKFVRKGKYRKLKIKKDPLEQDIEKLNFDSLFKHTKRLSKEHINKLIKKIFEKSDKIDEKQFDELAFILFRFEKEHTNIIGDFLEELILDYSIKNLEKSKFGFDIFLSLYPDRKVFIDLFLTGKGNDLVIKYNLEKIFDLFYVFNYTKNTFKITDRVSEKDWNFFIKCVNLPYGNKLFDYFYKIYDRNKAMAISFCLIKKAFQKDFSPFFIKNVVRYSRKISSKDVKFLFVTVINMILLEKNKKNIKKLSKFILDLLKENNDKIESDFLYIIVKDFVVNKRVFDTNSLRLVSELSRFYEEDKTRYIKLFRENLTPKVIPELKSTVELIISSLHNKTFMYNKNCRVIKK